jgi:hypothetical protein
VVVEEVKPGTGFDRIHLGDVPKLVEVQSLNCFGGGATGMTGTCAIKARPGAGEQRSSHRRTEMETKWSARRQATQRLTGCG